MSNVDFPYQSVLITGASSGVGEALAIALDRLGVQRIVLVARRKAKLVSLAQRLNCATDLCVADLSTDEGMSKTIAALSDVDLLINNAGVGSFGLFSQLDADSEAAMVRLNCEAPLRLTGAILPTLVKNNHGCVVNIASGLAFQSMPYMSTYAATKAFLLHWSEGVSGELSGSDVRFVTICPGNINTEFAEASAIPLGKLPGVAWVTCTLIDVVDATISAIYKNKTVSVVGLGNKIGGLSSRLAPRWIVRRIMAVLMGRSHQLTSG
jgi:short-subunit dehydrogenase